MKYPMAVVIIMLVLTMISCNNHNSMSDYRPVNERTVNFKDFCVRSETTNLETIAKGTIYVEGKDNRRSTHVEIVAWIEVDPGDWGGVSFSIPWGWRVTSITSNYSKNKIHDDPNKYISKWYTSDQGPKWHQRVEIDTSHAFSTLAGGGSGSVVIELGAIPEESDSSDTIAVLVGVGSEEKNGTRILQPDWKIVEVPLFPNNQIGMVK